MTAAEDHIRLAVNALRQAAETSHLADGTPMSPEIVKLHYDAAAWLGTKLDTSQRERVGRALFLTSHTSYRSDGRLRETWEHLRASFPEAAEGWMVMADAALAEAAGQVTDV
jgi:hypothetical protein